MKTNIKEVSYKNSMVEQKGSGWWTWDEYCDRCGKQTHKFGEHIMLCFENESVDRMGKDYCIECLRKLIEEYGWYHRDS